MDSTTFRRFIRTAWLVGSLVECLVRFALLRVAVRVSQGRGLNMHDRALWLHRSCLRITRRMGICLQANAALPADGLIVSNHLSHMDILLYGALGPVVFVSKKDVRAWPLLGQLAACGGTVFVDRARSTQSVDAARHIEQLLRGNIPVLLFPEGTSSNGTSVLPFRSPLFESAIRAEAPITAAAIGYAAAEVPESDLSYWGDKVFFPHLYRTLGHRQLTVHIRFAATATVFTNRKEAARAMHEAVSGLREAMQTLIKDSDSAHSEPLLSKRPPQAFAR